LITRKLASVQTLTIAAPKYLAERGTPREYKPTYVHMKASLT